MVDKYKKMADEIMQEVGGVDNVTSLTHCVTRLRFKLKNDSIVNEDTIKNIDGVISIINSGGQKQIVIGTDVPKVYQVIQDNYAVDGASHRPENNELEDVAKQSLLNKLFDVISSIFLPLLGGMGAAGILKGMLVGLSSANVISPETGIYTLFYSLSDAIFYFMPLALAYTAAKKFNANRFVAFTIVAGMIYPNLLNLATAGEPLNLFGFDVTILNYTSTVLQPIIVVYILSIVEKFAKKIVPSVIQTVIVPLIAMVIVFPIAIIIVGPLFTTVSGWIADLYSVIYNISPAIAGAFMGAFWPVSIVAGLHWGFFPIVMNNIGAFGYDTLLPLTVAANFAAAGAAFGVFMKTKNKELKEISGTAAFSAFVGGVTEPAIYGVNLKFKKPFYISCLMSAIGGVIVGIFNGQFTTIFGANIITLPAIFLFPNGLAMTIACIIGFVGTTVGTYLFGYNDDMLK